MSEKKEKHKAGLLSAFFAVAVGLISIALVIVGELKGNKDLELFGIGVSIVFAFLVFFIPYLRRNGYIRWLAWLALGDAAWWTYTIFVG